ncbi:MAG: DNA mismatch repair endonuclease MutL [Clostridiales Family XIII bacterium]|nr:DNA mismatch repair endonuclease MutL [Clostridiales Family XIII bacterium]
MKSAQIIKLDKSVAEKIAAGEVVQNPLSVVKELIENSIDAGATQIELRVFGGGQELIEIRDNGSGIARDELELAFVKHATSKIQSADDLNHIGSLGFRGEALASIKTVAKVELVTRTSMDDVATSISFGDSNVYVDGEAADQSVIRPASGEVGTKIIVKDLFYNTPARKKFLKSDRTETNRITDFITRLSIAYPDIRITYYVDGKQVLATRGDGSLDHVIINVLGADVFSELIYVDSLNYAGSVVPDDLSPTIRIRAYISRQGTSRKSKKFQVFYVNRRYVQDNLVSKAVAKAYESLIMPGRYPVAYVFVDVDPSKVDVNVHPQKLEIRWADEKEIFDSVNAAIRRRLLDGSVIGSAKEALNPQAEDLNSSPDYQEHLEFQNRKAALRETALNNATVKYAQDTQDIQGPQEMQVTGSSDYKAPHSYLADTISHTINQSDVNAIDYVDANAPFVPVVNINRLLSSDDDCVDSSKHTNGMEPLNSSIANKMEAVPVQPAQPEHGDGGALQAFADMEHGFDLSSIDTMDTADSGEQTVLDHHNLQYIGNVFATYLIAKDEKNLYLVDQHAAHERINYEKLMKAERARQDTGEKIASQSLLIAQTINLSNQQMDNINELMPDLEDIGFEFEQFSPNDIILRAIPIAMDIDSAIECIRDIAMSDSSIHPDVADDEARHEALIMRACKMSVKANNNLHDDDANRLIQDLFACENPYSCPHGRPVIIKLEKHDMEKMFKRV